MKYRKKPVVIRAVQWDGKPETLHAFLAETDDRAHREDIVLITSPKGHITVRTLEGDMTCEIGDWLICGVKSEFYPCKPDVFEATYEPAE